MDSKENIYKKYKGASITNIRRGKGDRNVYVYAEIITANGELLVSALLDYCVERMEEASLFWDDSENKE